MVQIVGRFDVQFVKKNSQKIMTFQSVTVFCPQKKSSIIIMQNL